MKSIRRFVYAAVLVVSAFSFGPSPVSAQNAAGTFDLAHEVHWQNSIVPAGKYHFTVGTSGPGLMLTLRNLSASGTSYMLLTTDNEETQAPGASQLVLVSRSAGSFVSTMQLPEFGLKLYFAVPSETHEAPQTVASASGTH